MVGSLRVRGWVHTGARRPPERCRGKAGDFPDAGTVVAASARPATFISQIEFPVNRDRPHSVTLAATVRIRNRSRADADACTDNGQKARCQVGYSGPCGSPAEPTAFR